jgi:nucleoside-diphosphate-sugar epimerase
MTSTVFVDEPLARPRAVLAEEDADLEGTPDGYPDDPHARYIYGKRQCELLLRDTSLPFSWTIIRPVNVYGVSDPQHRLRWWIARATDGQPIICPDDFPMPSGERNNLMVYSADVATAQLASLGNPAAGGRTYLLAMDEALSVPELVEAIAGVVGLKAPALAKVPRALLDRTPLGDNPAGTFRVPILWPGVRIANMKVKEDLGWRPTPLGGWLPLVVKAVMAEASATGWPSPVAYENRSVEARLARIWLEAQARFGEELIDEASRPCSAATTP